MGLGSPAESIGKLQLRRRGSGKGAEEGLRPALTAPSSLSRAVVEVTGHAHVLLAAFEKVSAFARDQGALPMPVTRERRCFETRSLNLGSGLGQMGLVPEGWGRWEALQLLWAPGGRASRQRHLWKGFQRASSVW